MPAGLGDQHLLTNPSTFIKPAKNSAPVISIHAYSVGSAITIIPPILHFPSTAKFFVAKDLESQLDIRLSGGTERKPEKWTAQVRRRSFFLLHTMLMLCSSAQRVAGPRETHYVIGKSDLSLSLVGFVNELACAWWLKRGPGGRGSFSFAAAGFENLGRGV